MIGDTFEKSRMEALELRKKINSSDFSELALKLELRFRRTHAMENLTSLRLRDRLYSGPFFGYVAKLLVSIARLPVRLKQIYENLENLQRVSGRLELQVESMRTTSQSVEIAQSKFQETFQTVEILKEMNHNVIVQNDTFCSEMREKISRCMETISELENRILTSSSVSASPRESVDSSPDISSAFYAAFERRFRSLSSDQDQHFSSYLPFLRSLRQPAIRQKAVDLGCGRGEWLKIIEQEGFDAIGVDRNSTTNASGRANAFTVVDSDALEYLRRNENGSFHLISSFHLIEHVEPGYLLRLIQESFRTLKPGGLLILETPNPENVMVGTCNFYMDPTHKRPIPPAPLGFMTDYFGFELVDCVRFHPGLPAYKGNDEYLGKIASCFSVGQDYAIIAKKPEEIVRS